MFKDNLKNLREKKGFSKQYMADNLGIAYMNYCHYEKRGSEPQYAILCKISKLLDVSVDFLLSDELTIDNGIMSMERLPASESMCFTPAYQLKGTPYKESIDEIVLKVAHNKALDKAKEIYKEEFNNVLFKETLSDIAKKLTDEDKNRLRMFTEKILADVSFDRDFYERMLKGTDKEKNSLFNSYNLATNEERPSDPKDNK